MDGKIYIAVNNQDGRGDPLSVDDRINSTTADEINQDEIINKTERETSVQNDLHHLEAFAQIPDYSFVN